MYADIGLEAQKYHRKFSCLFSHFSRITCWVQTNLGYGTKIWYNRARKCPSVSVTVEGLSLGDK